MTSKAQREAIGSWRRLERALPASERLENGGFPRHLRRPLSEIEPWPDQEKVYGQLVGYVEWFAENWRTGAGQTLVGRYGLGKTLLAAGVASELVVNQNYVAAFVTLDQYIRDRRQEMTVTRLSAGSDDIAGAARLELDELLHMDWIYRRGAYLLVLDDVGREYRTASGWAAQEFESLLRARYAQGLPTLLTTNLALDRWDEEFSAGMRSFVREACPEVEF